MRLVHNYYIRDLKKEKIDSVLKNKKYPIRPKVLGLVFLSAKIQRILAKNPRK
jgi:hypothetical protein